MSSKPEHKERWLITSSGSDYEPLMGFYVNMDRETAIQEFARQNFKAAQTFVLEIHAVGEPERIQGTYETSLKLVAF